MADDDGNNASTSGNGAKAESDTIQPDFVQGPGYKGTSKAKSHYLYRHMKQSIDPKLNDIQDAIRHMKATLDSMTNATGHSPQPSDVQDPGYKGSAKAKARYLYDHMKQSIDPKLNNIQDEIRRMTAALKNTTSETGHLSQSFQPQQSPAQTQASPANASTPKNPPVQNREGTAFTRVTQANHGSFGIYNKTKK